MGVFVDNKNVNHFFKKVTGVSQRPSPDINLKNTVDGVPVSQLPTIIFYHQKLYLKIMRIINLFKRQQHLFHNNLLPKADS